MKALSYLLWFIGGLVGVSIIIYIATVLILIRLVRDYDIEIGEENEK
jgi:hypothetical protein